MRPTAHREHVACAWGRLRVGKAAPAVQQLHARQMRLNPVAVQRAQAAVPTATKGVAGGSCATCSCDCGLDFFKLKLQAHKLRQLSSRSTRACPGVVGDWCDFAYKPARVGADRSPDSALPRLRTVLTANTRGPTRAGNCDSMRLTRARAHRTVDRTARTTLTARTRSRRSSAV